MKVYDVCVIGAGPGGYVACIHGAQRGLSVLSVEARGTLGGTCLNEGCIPSKALLHSSHLYHEVQQHGAEHGLAVQGLQLQLGAMMKRKDGIVAKNTQGIAYLYKKYGITRVQGHGSLNPQEGMVDVRAADGSITSYAAKHIVLATGSEIVELSSVAPFDHQYICNSTDALAFEKVPRRLAVIGGGVIGLELGSVWHRLGADVTVVEASPALVGGFDGSLSRFIQRHLEKTGLKISLSSTLQSVMLPQQGPGGEQDKSRSKGPGKSQDGEPSVEIAYIRSRKGGKQGDKGEEVRLQVDKVLVCVGRKPRSGSAGLEQRFIVADDRGFIPVSKTFETTAKNVYAIGDVIAGPMLAHRAEREGVAVMDRILGQASYHNHHITPNVVYTQPELAAIGQTEAQLKAAGTPYKTGMFHLKGNARAKVYGEDGGFIRLYAHRDTDEILGAHMAAPAASELIAELSVAMNFSATAEDLARSTHAHPSVSEAIKEVALAVAGASLHS